MTHRSDTDPVLPLWEHVRKLREVAEAAVTDDARDAATAKAYEAEFHMARTPVFAIAPARRVVPLPREPKLRWTGAVARPRMWPRVF